MRRCRNTRGAALLATFLMMLVLAGLAAAISTFSMNSQLTGSSAARDQQAFYIAQAGSQRARQALAASTWEAASSPGNTYSESFGAGVYEVTIVATSATLYTITSDGYVPNQTAPVARRRLVETGVPVTLTDGTNFSLTATASASSSGPPTPPSLAKDGDLGTRWRAGSSGDGWLAMDFGAATTLDKIVIREDSNINGISIQYSDNGSSWTTITGQTVVESPSLTWTATFAGISHRHFRASITASGGSARPAVNEMQSYNVSVSDLDQGEVTTTW